MTDQTSSTESDRVRVGHVAGPHGVRGDVLIKSYTDIPLDIASYGPLGTQHGTTLVIKKCRASSKGVVAFVEGVTNRGAAEALKGTELYLQRDQLPEPDEDEWYITDLIGLEVRDEADCNIGSVVTVHDFGAGELLELKLTDRAQSVLAPFTTETVPVVDIAEGFVRVHLTSEFLDEDENAEAPGVRTE